MGLDYLTLARPAPSLSGGEMQRIRLAAQVGSGLCGVLYVLDEPTIGLHPRDNARLLDALKKLRDLGNTLLLVEHDREVIANADKLLDFGPGAGRHGGQIVAEGSPDQVGNAPRLGHRTLSHGQEGHSGSYEPADGRERMTRRQGDAETRRRRSHPISASPCLRAPAIPGLRSAGHGTTTSRTSTSRFPLGTFTVVTGPSGSGKSSLVEDVLYASLARTLHRAKAFAGAHDSIRGIEQINKVIRVDQQPLGQTPSSNPATFTGVFELIRALYAQLPEAKLRGYQPRRFSFNVPGGRCEKCEGNGQLRIEMHFLPDVWVECDTCRGQRYNEETLAVRYHGKSIAEVLDMPCGEAVQLFQSIPKIRRILQTLCDVGLDYLTLGQSAPTLSGGEAQRVKLAAELSRPDTGNTLYLLDEPTTGLHFDDLAKLLDVLNRLVELGNTVVVIEHNLDVIKTADWVIDMGPEAGDEGGYVVVAGTPEDVAEYAEQRQKPVARDVRRSRRGDAETRRHGDEEVPASPRPRVPASSSAPRSYTGEALIPVLAAGPHAPRKLFDFAAAEALARGRPRHHRGRPGRPHAVGDRRPPLAHRGPRGPQRQALPLGRPHPGRGDRPHPEPIGAVQRDRLELAIGRRDPRGEEVRRLVLPRHYGRGMAAEDEVPHGPQHVLPRRARAAAGPQAAERHARAAALRHRAAGQGPQAPRSVAGDRAPRA